MIMAGTTIYININNKEEGRRIKGRVKVKDGLKLQVKTEVKLKVDREGKEKTDLLIRVRISSITQTTSLGNIDTLLEEANTSTSTTTTTPTPTKKKTIKRKNKKKKTRKTKNHVSSAQKRSNITLEVFVGTRLVSEYTSDPWLSIVVVYVCRVGFRTEVEVEVERRTSRRNRPLRKDFLVWVSFAETGIIRVRRDRLEATSFWILHLAAKRFESGRLCRAVDSFKVTARKRTEFERWGRVEKREGRIELFGPETAQKLVHKIESKRSIPRPA